MTIECLCVINERYDCLKDNYQGGREDIMRHRKPVMENDRLSRVRKESTAAANATAASSAAVANGNVKVAVLPLFQSFLLELVASTFCSSSH